MIRICQTNVLAHKQRRDAERGAAVDDLVTLCKGPGGYGY